MKTHVTTIRAMLWGFAVGGLLIVAWIQQTQRPETNTTRALAQIDARASHIVVTRFDRQGNRFQTLSAASLQHFARKDHTHYTNLAIDSREKSNQPFWHLTAETADSYFGNTLFQLLGSVHLTQPKTPTAPATQLETTQFTFLPNNHYGQTTVATTLTRGTLTIHGIGMRIYTDKHEMQFLSAVHGTYLPSNDQGRQS